MNAVNPPMISLPQRHSLVGQLSDILRKEVRAGRWSGWLPKERDLARAYQVSRCTLRGALGHLRREGLVETRHGLGTRVVAGRVRGRRRERCDSVGTLLPWTLDQSRHFVTLVVDDLREVLFDRGFKLVVHEHPQVASRRPFEFLGKLAGQQRHGCWLLVGCGHETLRWFSENRLPAVVSGTCDPALGLPFISLDNHALGRHAALTLLQHGHRRIGALLTHSNPGLKSGLNDILGAGASGASLVSFETDDTAESVANAVDRLMAGSQRPTAIFAAESGIYLSAFARLTQLRLRVPEEVSLICRDDEPYLRSLLPTPARYSKNPHLYARRLLSLILKTAAAEPTGHIGAYIMPEFVPGSSLRRLDYAAAAS
jgi:DNA-binding LacI/PurR family transcriptional regulator